MRVTDPADKATADDERAMQLFQRARADRLAAEPLPGDRVCDDCGIKIPPARVALLPRTRRCCRCQGELEQR